MLLPSALCWEVLLAAGQPVLTGYPVLFPREAPEAVGPQTVLLYELVLFYMQVCVGLHKAFSVHFLRL